MQKYKIDIKLTKTLQIEHITVMLLLAISIVSLIVSIFLEHLRAESLCTYIHLDFLVNLSLGIAASAFISFVSLVFSYWHRKDNNVTEIESRLIQIFDHYTTIYQLITNQDGVSEHSYHEENLSKKINVLIKEIDDEINAYKQASFQSKKVEEINKALQDHIINILHHIDRFCSIVLNGTYMPKNKNLENNNVYIKGKYLKDAKIECYQLLIQHLEQNYPYATFKALYTDLINRPGVANDITASHMADLGEAVRANSLARTQLTNHLLMNIDIYPIFDRYCDKFAAEQYRYRDKLTEILEIMDEKNMKGPKYTQKYLKIDNAIRQGNFDEAEERLNELETIARNYKSEQTKQ